MTEQTELFKVTMLPEDTDKVCDCLDKPLRAVLEVELRLAHKTLRLCASGLEQYIMENLIGNANK